MFIVYVLALLLSFYLMAKIVDGYFIDSLDRIAKRLDMSSDAAGATLMAVGSSAPELFIALIAVLKPGEHEAIGMGTIVGSAIFNILVITGFVGIVRKSKIPWQGASRDLFFYTVTIIVLILFFLNGELNTLETVIMIVFYFVYVLIVIFWKKLFPKISSKEIEIEEEEEEPEVYDKWWKRPMELLNKILDLIFPKKEKYWLAFSISVGFIALLSWVLVESAIEISHVLHIPEAIIALTVLAVGTSIPDLFSSIIVAKQGRGGMAVSNGIGSNIFDILIGLGLPFLIMILMTGENINVGTSDLMQSIILLFGTVILLIMMFVFNKWCIGKKMGYFLVGIYVLYVLWQFAVLYEWDKSFSSLVN